MRAGVSTGQFDLRYSAHAYSGVFDGDTVGSGHGRGRLDSPKCWAAQVNDQNQWLQLDLGALRYVDGVATKGRAEWDQWVTAYRMSVSADGSTWEDVDEGAEFSGNNDRNTLVTNHFETPKLT
eukprot:288907-Rhodomonas_salina.1